MENRSEVTAKVRSEYGRHAEDCGSSEVQVALLTARINHLTEHLKRHRKDFASRRGLMLMVGRRSRLLRFLARTRRDGYRNLVQRLGLRK